MSPEQIAQGNANRVVAIRKSPFRFKSPEAKKAMSEARRKAWQKGTYKDVDWSARPPVPGGGRFNYSGGRQGERYAELLCPAGYVREYLLHAPLRRYRLDFALVDRKINIEIDGFFHVGSQSTDQDRDAVLKSLGWKVIRIRDGAIV